MTTAATAPAVIRQRDIPETIRGLDILPRSDYADLFTASSAAPAERSPEDWGRAIFTEAPMRLQALLAVALLAQGVLLGMRRGWRIDDHGEDWFRMAAGSTFLTGHVVFLREGRQVSMATFVRYERRLGALVWPPVSVLHRRIARMLVRHAATVA